MFHFSDSRLNESIARFREGFWNRRSLDRPPVGVFSGDVFLPIKYLRKTLSSTEVRPQHVTNERVMTDYEFDATHRSVWCDEWIPFSAPWRAVPWLEACCGCTVKYASGALAPEPCAGSLEELARIELPVDHRWWECLQQETRWLVQSTPADCWVSPTILRGPADVIAAMRGMGNFYCDLHDGPRLVADTAQRVNRLLMDALDANFSIVTEQRGGYGHIFGYWAPQPTVVIQDDVMGMCAPEIYRDLFGPLSAQVVEHVRGPVLFHLHSTGYAHFRHVLDIPGLAGLQMTVEANGPSLTDMAADLREILERTRLILLVDHGFEQLADVLRSLPTDGLYVLIPNRYLESDGMFLEFVQAVWRSHRSSGRAGSSHE